MVFIDNDGDIAPSEPSYGLKSATGERPRMEDAAVAKLHVPISFSHDSYESASVHYFAVYDGHGGSHVAEHCAQTVHETFADVLSTSSTCTIEDALLIALLEANDSLDAAACQLMGSTAAAAVVGSSKVWTAHCGKQTNLMGPVKKGVLCASMCMLQSQVVSACHITHMPTS
jgi:protein phosphatase 2C